MYFVEHFSLASLRLLQICYSLSKFIDSCSVKYSGTITSEQTDFEWFVNKLKERALFYKLSKAPYSAFVCWSSKSFRISLFLKL